MKGWKGNRIGHQIAAMKGRNTLIPTNKRKIRMTDRATKGINRVRAKFEITPQGLRLIDSWQEQLVGSNYTSAGAYWFSAQEISEKTEMLRTAKRNSSNVKILRDNEVVWLYPSGAIETALD